MSEYTKEEFEESYKRIYESLTKNGISQQNHCVMFLGGQPGTGKSSFVNEDGAFSNYININGDNYRKFHPHYQEIIKYDLENMASRTQSFVNECIERLISELSDDGYNIIIEGTLRNPDVTINTCEALKNKGYTTELYIISADAISSWKTTINRAYLLKDLGKTPRLVPIDKYNYIVNNLPQSVNKIENSGCFDRIHVLDRNNKELYSNSSNYISAAKVIEKQLELEKWNEQFPVLADQLIDIKMDLLQGQKKRRCR